MDHKTFLRRRMERATLPWNVELRPRGRKPTGRGSFSSPLDMMDQDSANPTVVARAAAV
ncbi:MAG: hypothetical protein AAFS10_21145 [Myxococcota bacterium]